MNISIMIPAKNRPTFRVSQLRYYSQFSFKGIILIENLS